MQEILTPKSPPAGVPGRRFGVLAGVIVLLLVVGLGVGGLRLTGVIGGQTPEQRRAAALAQTQAELRPQVEELMRLRASFFAAERAYLPAMKKARTAVGQYNQKLEKVESEIDRINAANASRLTGCGSARSCPDLDYPAYPRIPVLSAQVKALRTVTTRTAGLHTRLSAVRATDGMAMAYGELLSAVDLLGQDAEDNLASLNEMLAPPPKGADGPVRMRIMTLNGNSSLPMIRRMNADLVRLLKKAELPVGRYDLPGGKDAFRGDNSTSV